MLLFSHESLREAGWNRSDVRALWHVITLKCTLPETLNVHRLIKDIKLIKLKRVQKARTQAFRSAFLKLWSADHLWSSRSVLLVLQTRSKKKIKFKLTACHTIAKISEFVNDALRLPFTFSPSTDILWNLLPSPVYWLSTLLSATNGGSKALWTWCFSPPFPCTSGAAPVTQPVAPEIITEDKSTKPFHVFTSFIIVLPTFPLEMVTHCTSRCTPTIRVKLHLYLLKIGHFSAFII